MTDPLTVVVFPGAGGELLDNSIFGLGSPDNARFLNIEYPGWRRYVAADFSAEALMAELAASIEASAPRGPLSIIGLSIGGHFGYAVGLILRARGREIVNFCAIDSFMIKSSGPSAGWWLRSLAQGFDLLRAFKMREFSRFALSKFWRVLLRLSGPSLPRLTRALGARSRSAAFGGSLFQHELSMRLLIRGTADWLVSLDSDPVQLHVRSVLLRTRRSAADDAAWRRRCPLLSIHDLPGLHEQLLEPGNLCALRDAFAAATRESR